MVCLRRRTKDHWKQQFSYSAAAVGVFLQIALLLFALLFSQCPLYSVTANFVFKLQRLNKAKSWTCLVEMKTLLSRQSDSGKRQLLSL